jgi:hypothetical protein
MVGPGYPALAKIAVKDVEESPTALATESAKLPHPQQ